MRAVRDGTERLDFWCPNERAERLYRTPVLNRQVVECLGCGERFGREALEGKVSDAFEAMLRHVAVAVVTVDGVLRLSESRAVAGLLSTFTGSRYSAEDLATDMERFQHEEAVEVISGLAGSLSETRREVGLRVAIELAVSDGRIDQRQFRLLHSISDALGFDGQHCNRLIAQMDFTRDR